MYLTNFPKNDFRDCKLILPSLSVIAETLSLNDQKGAYDFEIHRTKDDVVLHVDSEEISHLRYKPGELDLFGSLEEEARRLIEFTHNGAEYKIQVEAEENEKLKQNLTLIIGAGDKLSASFSWWRFFYDRIELKNVANFARDRNKRLIGMLGTSIPEQFVKDQIRLLNEALKCLPSEELKVYKITLPVSAPINEAIFDQFGPSGRTFLDNVNLFCENNELTLEWELEKDLTEISPEVVKFFEEILECELSGTLVKNKKVLEGIGFEDGIHADLLNRIELAQRNLVDYQMEAMKLFAPLQKLFEEMQPDDCIYLTKPALLEGGSDA